MRKSRAKKWKRLKIERKDLSHVFYPNLGHYSIWHNKRAGYIRAAHQRVLVQAPSRSEALEQGVKKLQAIADQQLQLAIAKKVNQRSYGEF